MSKKRTVQLYNEIQFPDSGRKSLILCDDDRTKVVLFAFAAGASLAEHRAPYPAMIQIIHGDAKLTVGDEDVSGQPGTWIQMEAQMPHSIEAATNVLMLLTLIK